VNREAQVEVARCAASSDGRHRAVTGWRWLGAITILVVASSVGAAVIVSRAGSDKPTGPAAQPPPAQAFADAADRYPTATPAAVAASSGTVTPATNPSAPRIAGRPRPAPATSPAGAARPSAPAPARVGLAASRPVWIDIRSIGTSAPIDPLGLTADGSLAVPNDFSRAGYYTGRPTPGEVGPAIIVAHVDSRRGPAVFVRLRDLQPGAEAVVTRADGSRLAFVIDRVERHPKNAFPTEEVYGPTPEPTLRLITCGGPFDQGSGHYRDNYIAFAHLRGPV